MYSKRGENNHQMRINIIDKDKMAVLSNNKTIYLRGYI